MSQRESLILVPGLMCDATVWRNQIAALGSRHNIQVAEHGQADSLAVMAQQILSRAPPRFALAGHSMGGRVALELLAMAPERVSRLALLDTGLGALPAGPEGERERAVRSALLDLARREGMLVMGRQWARGMVHPAHLTNADLMDEIHQMIARSTVAQFEAQIRSLLHRPDRSNLLAQIHVPTLVLCGQEDAWSPLAQHELLARGIANSTLVAVPHCGHMSTMEQPAAVNAELSQWLSV
jgi:pimeloyl-ACP methyl ester carboxylesterase